MNNKHDYAHRSQACVLALGDCGITFSATFLRLALANDPPVMLSEPTRVCAGRQTRLLKITIC